MTRRSRLLPDRRLLLCTTPPSVSRPVRLTAAPAAPIHPPPTGGSVLVCPPPVAAGAPTPSGLGSLPSPPTATATATASSSAAAAAAAAAGHTPAAAGHTPSTRPNLGAAALSLHCATRPASSQPKHGHSTKCKPIQGVEGTEATHRAAPLRMIFSRTIFSRLGLLLLLRLRPFLPRPAAFLLRALSRPLSRTLSRPLSRRTLSRPRLRLRLLLRFSRPAPRLPLRSRLRLPRRSSAPRPWEPLCRFRRPRSPAPRGETSLFLRFPLERRFSRSLLRDRRLCAGRRSLDLDRELDQLGLPGLRAIGRRRAARPPRAKASFRRSC